MVVLSFWATWCTPCQEELPRLSHLSERYAGEPVKFIAVSIDEDKSRSQLAAFLAKRAIHLETWTGASTATMKALRMGEIVPATVILDEMGEPLTRISGEAQVEDVVSRVDWLLRGRSGPAPSPFLKRF